MDSFVGPLVVGTGTICLILASCWTAVRAIRWAKKGDASRKILSFGLLFLAVPAIAEPPQQNVVQVVEERIRKKDAGSGEPETPDQKVDDEG